MVAADLAGWFGGSTTTPLLLAPFAFAFGGVAQFLAGMWVTRSPPWFTGRGARSGSASASTSCSSASAGRLRRRRRARPRSASGSSGSGRSPGPARSPRWRKASCSACSWRSA
nr:hypothetical protein [Amycolatopsis rubida]